MNRGRPPAGLLRAPALPVANAQARRRAALREWEFAVLFKALRNPKRRFPTAAGCEPGLEPAIAVFPGGKHVP